MRARIFVVVMSAVIVPVSASAGTYDWIGGYMGSFNTAANWQEHSTKVHAVPGVSDDAWLTQVNSGPKLGSNVQNRSLLANTVSYMDLAGYNYAADKSPLDAVNTFEVGPGGDLTLFNSVNSPSTFSVASDDPTYIIFGGGGTGILRIQGSATGPLEFVAGDGIIVGHGGSGNGTVYVTGTNSKLTVQNTEAIVGVANGTGSLVIENGGALSVSQRVSIGQGFGTQTSGGTLKVDGIGSSAQYSNEIRTAYGGPNMSGAITVSNGGTLAAAAGNSADALLGFNGSGSTTVTGTGSSWTHNGNVYLGYTIGGGSLKVEDSGTLNAKSSLYIGGSSVAGGSTLTVQSGGALRVGSSSATQTSPAMITVRNGDAATVDGGSGLVGTLTGGVSGTNNQLRAVKNGIVEIDGGSLTLGHSGSAGTLALDGSSGSDKPGTLQGTFTQSTDITGNVTNNGLILPGDTSSAGIGTLDIAGNFAQATTLDPAILNIDVNSATAYDKVNVSGTATLGGRLVVDTAYSPACGTDLTVMTFSSLSGRFNDGITNTIGSTNEVWAHILSPTPATATSLHLQTRVAGDANGDGHTTGADYTIWAANFGTSNPVDYRDGDFNGDGKVTGADYTIWAAHLGQSCAAGLPSVAAAVVPEPSSIALLGLGMSIVAWRARKLRR